MKHGVTGLLLEAFNIKTGDIITLTGAGGKTTALYQLGKELQERKVLLTLTTKMKYPEKGQADEIYSEKEVEILTIKRSNGRTFLYGERLQNNKCGSVSEANIEIVAKGYDMTVIEADGTRGLPLKGYLKSEPCIPNFATINVGIATIYSIGQIAGEAVILRKEEFTRMLNIKMGEVLTEKHIAKWIAHSDGMFRGSQGKRILFFNQIESEKEKVLAQAVIHCLDEDFRKQLFRIIIGSINNRTYQIFDGREEDSG